MNDKIKKEYLNTYNKLEDYNNLITDLQEKAFKLFKKWNEITNTLNDSITYKINYHEKRIYFTIDFYDTEGFEDSINLYGEEYEYITIGLDDIFEPERFLEYWKNKKEEYKSNEYDESYDFYRDMPESDIISWGYDGDCL